MTEPTAQDQALQAQQKFLASLEKAPTKDQIAAWKQQVPNGVIRVFSPDGKRAFYLRGISGVELRELQKMIPANATDAESDFQMQACAAACMWTNTTLTGKLDVPSLRSATAGLPSTLFTVIQELSDFFPPAQIEVMGFDL